MRKNSFSLSDSNNGGSLTLVTPTTTPTPTPRPSPPPTATPTPSPIPQTIDGYTPSIRDWNGSIWGSSPAAPTSSNTFLSSSALESSTSADLGPSYSGTVEAADSSAPNTFSGQNLTMESNSRLILLQGSSHIASANLVMANNSEVISSPTASDLPSATLAGSVQIGSGVTSYFGTDSQGGTFNLDSAIAGSGIYK